MSCRASTSILGVSGGSVARLGIQHSRLWLSSLFDEVWELTYQRQLKYGFPRIPHSGTSFLSSMLLLEGTLN